MPAKSHGLTGSSEYNTWREMKGRCLNPKHEAFPDYGGRGITVCKRWFRFEEFFADMGLRPTGMTLERSNTNGNYEPSNCRWATSTEQNRNRRNNRRIDVDGVALTAAEWSEFTGISAAAIKLRFCRYKWSARQTIGFDPPPPTSRFRNLTFKPRVDNTSGFKGVSKDHGGKWIARATINGCRKRLGLFSTPEEAANAIRFFLTAGRAP